MTYTGGSATDGTDPTVTVIEPQISTTKSVTDTDTDPATAIAEPGEILTYTVRFTNSGTSTAYEVTAEDTLPAGVQYNLAQRLSRPAVVSTPVRWMSLAPIIRHSQHHQLHKL